MDGYMKNAQGHLVPVANVKEIDKVRDEIVRKMVEGARLLAEHSRQFREVCFGEVGHFVELAAMEHGVTLGGDKGNLTLTSFDGTLRVTRASDEQITFTEGMTVARKLIFDCIDKWSDGANTNLAALVRKAFETDKAGHLSASKIMGLLSYQIEDDDWRKAMDVIRESVQVIGTKTYIRFYEREAGGEFKQIALG